MKKLLIMLAAVLPLLCLSACGEADIAEEGEQTEAGYGADIISGEDEREVVLNDDEKNNEGDNEMRINVKIGNEMFTAVMEDNKAAEEFVEMLKEAPVSVEMRDYSGFEKVGSLGRSLTASDSRLTTEPGDIVLYCGDQIVMFYGSNTWSYTKLGHIEELKGWEEALGKGDITAVFSVEE